MRRGDVLHWAVERTCSDSCEVLGLLLEAVALPNHLRFGGIEPEWSVRGKDGLGTALHQAVALNRPDLAAVLLEQSAGPRVQDTNGHTPEQIAEKLDDESTIRLLSAATEQC